MFVVNSEQFLDITEEAVHVLHFKYNRTQNLPINLLIFRKLLVLLHKENIDTI